jgi:hypothetical protein
MSCCGGGLRVVQGRALGDGSTAGGLVMLVYTGEDRRNLPYVAEGKVYFFGNNERRRVNAVPVRVLPQFLEPAGRYYGSFERWVEVESPQDVSEGPAAASAPPAPTEGLDAAQEPAQPASGRAASAGVAPAEVTESPTATESQGATPPAKKKGAGNVRA